MESNNQTNPEEKVILNEGEIPLNDKPIEELTLDEIIKLRRMLFRKHLSYETKKDHIKQLFSALNFKPKPTSFQEAFEFTEEKKQATLNVDLYYHNLKSFMKTYEQEKLKHHHIIRK